MFKNVRVVKLTEKLPRVVFSSLAPSGMATSIIPRSPSVTSLSVFLTTTKM